MNIKFAITITTRTARLKTKVSSFLQISLVQTSALFAK